jgi:sigma-B regulation protein RsbU (phosphoserine phosphatase)
VDALEANAVGLRMITALLDGSHLAVPDQIAAIIAAAAAEAAMTASTYLVDYPQRRLVPLEPTAAASPLEPQAVDGTVAGRAFRLVEALPGHEGDGRHHLWLPIVDGVERLGVVHVGLPVGMRIDDGPIRDQLRWLAHLAGHIIASKSPYGDKFHRVRTAQDRTVASELIWSLLPPLTVATDGLVISGLLEPAHSVAGDVFDYAISNDVADVAIVDATGHDIRSGIIGALTLAAYRNSRRRQLSLQASMVLVDETLLDVGSHSHATGIFGQLELSTGVFRYMNAGHPSPLLLRAGRVVRSMDGGRRTLFGFPGPAQVHAEEQLEPGDWIVLYTDGIPEARDEDRSFFGMDRFVDVIERCAADRLPAPETLRRIMQSILEHQHGTLQDDATVLLVQWANGGERQLNAC